MEHRVFGAVKLSLYDTVMANTWHHGFAKCKEHTTQRVKSKVNCTL
jgi:hypothetical protein